MLQERGESSAPLRARTRNGLERARVYVSCRVSDWTGQEDRDAVERRLPVWEKPTPPVLENNDTALLAPIFNDQPETAHPLGVKEPRSEQGCD